MTLLPLLAGLALAQPPPPPPPVFAKFPPRGEEGITLEGILLLPGTEGDEPAPALVMCHPDPRMGGAMTDFVVMGVCDEVLRQGIAVMRFNFRGVGGSTGEFADGVGEAQDVLGALDFLKGQQGVDADRVFLGGYSFGAAMALKAIAKDETPVAYVGVSLPFSAKPHEQEELGFASDLKKPAFVVIGSEDEHGSADAIRELLPKEHTQVVTVEGADHFYFEPEDALESAAKAVASFLEEQAKALPEE